MPKKKTSQSVGQILRQIRPAWIEYVGDNLAGGLEARAEFEEQLERFFDLLEQSVATGDSAWMDSILLDWAKSSTRTNLEEGLYRVSFLMNRMIALTIQTANRVLTKHQAFDLLAAILPIYTYGLGVAARYEMEMRVSYISAEMERARKQAERVDRSKSAFISIAAHELKTPLTLIEGYASMMEDLNKERRDEKLSGLLAGMNAGVNRLRIIVDDMIDVSLIDNDLLRVNSQPAQIRNLFGTLRKELESVAQNRNLTMTFLSFEGDRQWIYLDAIRITQALRNVIGNAVKFTPDGGTILIGGELRTGFIEIFVKDNGIGISLKNQRSIFENFEQPGSVELHSSGRTKFKGRGPGLGLPIARGILEAHGGSIWVESPGYDEETRPGATFHILIPVRVRASNPKMSELFSALEKGNETRAAEQS